MVKGSEASARATPKSAWMAGSATITDHMPTPPMVLSVTATPRRSQALVESVSSGAPDPAAVCDGVTALINPVIPGVLLALRRCRGQYAHDPEKWEPVFGLDYAPRQNRGYLSPPEFAGLMVLQSDSPNNGLK